MKTLCASGYRRSSSSRATSTTAASTSSKFKIDLHVIYHTSHCLFSFHSKTNINLHNNKFVTPMTQVINMMMEGKSIQLRKKSIKFLEIYVYFSLNFNSYDERWNNPGFRGDGRAPSRPASPPAAPVNYNYQASAPEYQAPQAPRQQSNYNVPAVNYQDTTPSPNRFYPKGKLNLSRTPDGFQYTFNKA